MTNWHVIPWHIFPKLRKAQSNNCINGFLWNTIAYAYTNINPGSAKLPLMLGYGLVIIEPSFILKLFIHI